MPKLKKEENQPVEEIKLSEIPEKDITGKEAASEEPTANNIPPKRIALNGFGLRSDTNYVFREEDGLVDWIKMIPQSYFVINKSYENKIVKTLNKPLEEVSVDEVEPHQLLILLQGFRYVADLRGFRSLEYGNPSIGPQGEVSLSCSITWCGNYETNYDDIKFSGMGEATRNNTSPIGKNKIGESCFYLTAIAENRAFVRAVRNFLRIPVLGKDEISGAETSTPKYQEAEPILGSKPLDSLIKRCKTKGLTFQMLKVLANKHKDKLSDNLEEWEQWTDLNPKDIYVLLGVVGS
jgi:hypothetical protein